MFCQNLEGQLEQVLIIYLFDIVGKKQKVAFPLKEDDNSFGCRIFARAHAFAPARAHLKGVAPFLIWYGMSFAGNNAYKRGGNLANL